MPPENHLFITGTMASGTRQLRTILGADRRIALGAQRFQSRAWKDWSVTPDLYTAERFFDTEGDTELDAKNFNAKGEYYDDLAERFADCAYVGDDLPMAFLQIDKLAENFPGAKVIVMLRNPYDVVAVAEHQARLSGQSETARADLALAAWTRSVRLTQTDARPAGLDFHFVLFERLLMDGQGLDGIYAFLGLDPDPAVAARHDAVAADVRTEQQDRAQLASQYASAQIAENASIAIYRKAHRDLGAAA